MDVELPTTRRSRARVLTVVLCLLVAAVTSGVTYAELASFEPDALVGRVATRPVGLGPISGGERTPLPDQTLPAFGDGEPIRLADYRGNPLLVNFWATWCVPCVTEMPVLQQASTQVDGQMRFLGVNVQDSASKAITFLRDVGVTYDQANDPAAEFFRRIEGFGMPTTLLVDADGTIVYRHTGKLDVQQLTGLLRRHLDVEL